MNYLATLTNVSGRKYSFEKIILGKCEEIISSDEVY